MADIKPKISVEYSGDTAVVSFTDKKILEEAEIKALQDSLMSVVEGDAKNYILDFSNIQFLSSAVLGLLIRLSKKVYEQNGELVLCNISNKIMEVFKITKLTKVFDIYSDLETAKENITE